MQYIWIILYIILVVYYIVWPPCIKIRPEWLLRHSASILSNSIIYICLPPGVEPTVATDAHYWQWLLNTECQHKSILQIGKLISRNFCIIVCYPPPPYTCSKYLARPSLLSIYTYLVSPCSALKTYTPKIFYNWCNLLLRIVLLR